MLGIDFTQQIAQLRQRLDETASMSPIGSEVTAATGGVAAGKRGVAVGGDVIGNIYVGPPARDPAEALMIYRRVLVEDCRHMSLRGLDISASDPTGAQRRFELAQVYVNLLTKTQVTPERESQPLSVLEAVAGHRHVVLLGDPGSGKSTFLSHLALCLAKHGLEPQQNWLERLPSWPEQDSNMVPILVTLRDFARWLPDPLGIAEPHHLWDFIISRLEAQNLASAAKDFMLHDRLEHGQAVILLDGLDEIVVQRHRTFIRDVVDVFARRYPKCRVIVTCRTLSYQDPAWQLEDFNNFTLAPFNGEQIDQFITAWYGELARLGSIPLGSIEGVTRGLRGAVRRPDLWRLASNPLLLTVMALVHTHRGRLPQARALLYEESVDILLWLWEQVKVSGEDDGHRLQQLLEQAHRTDVDLKRALWRLAFEMHQESGTGDTETVADIGELRLHKTLMELHPDKSWDWAHEVVEVMKLRAGLLVERIPEVYAFPHRTFQEYLAGAHLSSEPDFAQQAERLAKEGAYWRDVILLGVGRLVYLNGDTAKPLALVAELCPAALADTDIAWRQVWLAGEVLLEIGLNRVNDSALGRELGERVRRGLVSLLSNGCLTPVEQAAAGDTLAAIGDPRFHVDRWYLPDEPMLGFVEIPDGPFRIGSDQKRDSQAFGREAPQHLISLPRYYIARYPVTVAQFQAFLEDTGDKWANTASGQGLLNHPVVAVSWHDAIAYCQWLTDRLREWEGTPKPLATQLRQEGWRVTLPSEAEWEKAARGWDSRIYPWGDEFDLSGANTEETGIGGTSTVGSFPRGASPYGCLDMAGNVWEWTRSLWGKDVSDPEFRYPYDPGDGREDLAAPDSMCRVMRGGAFFFDLRFVRCAFRGWDYPDGHDGNIGFRVVMLP